MSKRTIENLTYPELREEIYKLLAKDKAKLINTNYPAAKTSFVSPISNLTNKARQLQIEGTQKGLPYSRKIDQVTQRSKQGFDQQDINGLLDLLQNGQEQFQNQTTKKQLNKQFGDSVAYIDNYLNKKQSKDLITEKELARNNLNNVSKDVASIDQNNNQKIIDFLQLLRADKQSRRDNLIDTSEQFGKQQQAYNNMKLQADKQKFDTEVNTPYKNINLLEELLNSQESQNAAPADIHPDIENSKAQQLVQGLRAYGIDLNKPVDEWDKNRLTKSSYPSKRVADKNPYLLASEEVLSGITPKTKDAFATNTKGAVNELIQNGNISTQAINELPEALQIPFSQIEKQAKARNKDDLKKIEQKYIALGQHGSGAHLKAAAKSTRELNQALLAQRQKILQEVLNKELGYKQNKSSNTIQNASQSAQQGSNDYNNTLSNLKNTHNIGTTIFNNDQDEEDRLFKNYNNENDWQWPHLRDNIRNNKVGNIFNPVNLGELGRTNINSTNMPQIPANNVQTAYKQTIDVNNDLAQKLKNAEQQEAMRRQQADAARQLSMQQENARKQALLAQQLQQQTMQKSQQQMQPQNVQSQNVKQPVINPDEAFMNKYKDSYFYPYYTAQMFPDYLKQYPTNYPGGFNRNQLEAAKNFFDFNNNNLWEKVQYDGKIAGSYAIPRQKYDDYIKTNPILRDVVNHPIVKSKLQASHRHVMDVEKDLLQKNSSSRQPPQQPAIYDQQFFNELRNQFK